MVKKLWRHSAEFKFRGALEALEGSKTISYPATTVQGQWPCALSPNIIE